MTTIPKEQLDQQIESLRPWRYTHRHGDIVIKGDSKAAGAFDAYGRDLMLRIPQALLQGQRFADLRAIDLGCLEGHYSDVLCSLGFKEVVSIDLSEGHVRRAEFLLKQLKGHANATVLQGNVSDERLMGSLGKFNLVLFHGLLYHLKDPLKAFDILDGLMPKDGPFFLLLSTQYRCSFGALVSPGPSGEMQVKPLKSSGAPGALYSPVDGSVFERCSFILNPAAVYAALKLYGYQTIVAYDDPGGTKESFHSNIVAAKKLIPGLAQGLNASIAIPGVRFYDWDGRSVSGYHFDRRWRARVARLTTRAARKVAEWLR